MTAEAGEPQERSAGLGAVGSEGIPSIYLDPRHYDFLAELTAPPDDLFYQRMCARYGQAVLELGCGTGRVCLALARAGVTVTGVDYSQAMVTYAEQKALGLGLDVELHTADVRGFALERTFPLIIFPYNAFNHLLDLESIRCCLATVRAHMAVDSRFVIDTFQPSLSFLAGDPEERRLVARYVDPDGRGRIVMTEQNVYDAATQLNRVIWHYQINGRADAATHELTMRMFFPQELDALLALNGLDIEHKLGTYDETPFDSASPKQLVICRLSGSSA